MQIVNGELKIDETKIDHAIKEGFADQSNHAHRYDPFVAFEESPALDAVRDQLYKESEPLQKIFG